MLPSAASAVVFDPKLKKKKARAGSSDTDDDMSTGDWVVAILCSGISCIAGIVWMIGASPRWKNAWCFTAGGIVLECCAGLILEAIARSNPVLTAECRNHVWKRR